MTDLESLANSVKYMGEKLDMLVDAIIGDPTDDQKPGMRIRLDRIEQSHTGVKKILFTFGCWLLTVTGTIVAAIILRCI